jgi:hypothetical protein
MQFKLSIENKAPQNCDFGAGALLNASSLSFNDTYSAMD